MNINVIGKHRPETGTARSQIGVSGRATAMILATVCASFAVGSTY
ncbi:hypothetical protein SAMN04487843_1542, partial [Methylobacterium sp. ap11]